MNAQQDQKNETRKPGFLVRKEVVEYEQEIKEAIERSDAFFEDRKGSNKKAGIKVP